MPVAIMSMIQRIDDVLPGLYYFSLLTLCLHVCDFTAVSTCFKFFENFHSFFNKHPLGVYNQTTGKAVGGHCVKVPAPVLLSFCFLCACCAPVRCVRGCGVPASQVHGCDGVYCCAAGQIVGWGTD
jgi:hypothetical protein